MPRLYSLTNAGAGSTADSSKLSNVVLIDDAKWPYVQKRYSMTGRELQIAQSVCRGLSNQQIADNLKIQQGTVKTHMRNIYRKTWVNNKIAMLLRFVEVANGDSQSNNAQYHQES
jgi:DNA-binding NarL/FixJ family response regulator